MRNIINSRKILPPTLLLIGVLSFSQTRPDALSNYRTGRDLEVQGRAEEAENYYREAVRICFNEINEKTATIETYSTLTATLLRQKKYADVITWGDQGLKTQNDYRIVETMGEAYFYLENYTASIRAMQRYVNALPEGERAGNAYFFIGEIYRLQKKFRHADIAYTTAVKLQPSSALWWYRLGIARESAGELGPARIAYEQALKINPNYTQASEGLARARSSG
ncbi:MAG: tetratricopeptide repeat protein [Spirochaetaceae bacterium]|jgi:tetratricopeptide (TPR) repeat protein|nr:tetratricopeptide repeat protein [Spirochaetaceae bacterium]